MTQAAPSMLKTVTLELDRKRTMRLTLGDAREFRQRTVSEENPGGISLLRGDLARVSLAEEEWLILFSIMLKHDDPELTEDALANLMDMSGFVRAGEAFEELLSAFKAKEDGAGPEGPTA